MRALPRSSLPRIPSGPQSGGAIRDARAVSERRSSTAPAVASIGQVGTAMAAPIDRTALVRA